jgi:hypothetical protein
MDPPLERLKVSPLGLLARTGRGSRWFGGGHNDIVVGSRGVSAAIPPASKGNIAHANGAR